MTAASIFYFASNKPQQAGYHIADDSKDSFKLHSGSKKVILCKIEQHPQDSLVKDFFWNLNISKLAIRYE